MVTVTRTQHGPFERLVMTAPEAPRPAEVSAWRIGDMLVDTGSARAGAALVEALRDAPPRVIVCTHQHEDHVGGVAALRRAFGNIPVHVPRMHAGMLPTFDRVPHYRERHWGAPEAIPDAEPYDPGATFDAGPVTLETIATPGHTPGHCAIALRTESAVFACTGDLYVSARPLIAWFESAADDAVRSCRALASLGALAMLPAHGRARDDGAAALTEMADFVEREAARVEEAAARLGTRDPRVVAEVLWPVPSDFEAVSGGEFSHANFARSVLSPVRALPAFPA
jgi:glyoxylase-like metal-dependent hydrolase (beta-lactamase superfamily II)